MISNTVVLIIVVAVVAVVFVGVVAGFRYKSRAERRLLGGASILDEVAEDARLAQLLDDVDHPVPTKPPLAQVDSEIEAFRQRGRRKESADSKEIADLRSQLKDHGSRTD